MPLLRKTSKRLPKSLGGLFFLKKTAQKFWIFSSCCIFDLKFNANLYAQLYLLYRHDVLLYAPAYGKCSFMAIQ